jgi:hypothetical protein
MHRWLRKTRLLSKNLYSGKFYAQAIREKITTINIAQQRRDEKYFETGKNQMQLV